MPRTLKTCQPEPEGRVAAPVEVRLALSEICQALIDPRMLLTSLLGASLGLGALHAGG